MIPRLSIVDVMPEHYVLPKEGESVMSKTSIFRHYYTILGYWHVFNITVFLTSGIGYGNWHIILLYMHIVIEIISWFCVRLIEPQTPQRNEQSLKERTKMVAVLFCLHLAYAILYTLFVKVTTEVDMICTWLNVFIMGLLWMTSIYIGIDYRTRWNNVVN